MKQLAIILMAVLISGCAATTGFLYGPDATPDQIRDMVYVDAYSVGRARVMWACAKRERDIRANPEKGIFALSVDQQVEKAKLEIVNDILERIELVKLSNDPMGALNLYFYDELVREGVSEQTALLLLVQAAGNRVLSRIGIGSSGEGLDRRFKDIGFDRDLFLYAVGAYEKAVRDFGGM